MKSIFRLTNKGLITCHRPFHSAQLKQDLKRRTEIYCYGRLLQTVQSAQIFKHSRVFVDMKMKIPPQHLLFNFSKFMAENANKPSKARLKRFIFQHFRSIDSEYEPWVPTDYVEEPKMVKTIKDEEFRNWAYELNQLWPFLGKKMKREVQDNEDMYSIIYLENGIIMPGSQYRNYYYWDTYWIILGLIHCEMYKTVRGMLDNFIYLIDTFGYIPHGGRIYFIHRSQPPLFMPMMRLYYDATRDLQYIKYNIGTAERELHYWLTNHTVEVETKGDKFTLAIYGDESRGPRPEHYHSDTKAAEVFDDDYQKEEFFSELKAAAASGWNFSSRWFISDRGNSGKLSNTRTRSIVPVDLNAMLYWNMLILSDFYKLLGDENKSESYHKLAQQWIGAVTAVMWHEDRGCWFDYDLENLKPREYFYPSNITPLWSGCYIKSNKNHFVRKVIKYLRRENALLSGGVPTSFVNTGEKWDYPFAWSPLQHILVEALSSTNNDEAQWLAFCIAQRWIRNNFLIFEEYGVMFQKYKAVLGQQEEQEFGTQIGYGWTNGVCLHFLQKYADKLSLDDFRKPVITAGQTALQFGHIDTRLHR